MVPPMVDPVLHELPAACRQALVVRSVAGAPTRATVACYERNVGAWVMRTVRPAMVGRAGIVAAAQKREGDGGTPAGVHRLGTAFGYAPSIATKLAYRQATTNDYWVDDPESPAYNTWVIGKPACSAEALRRDDDAYSLGAVIEWNTTPVVPGRGSAIFLHVWGGPGHATAGCVALARDDVAALLAWLDRDRAPFIVVVAP